MVLSKVQRTCVLKLRPQQGNSKGEPSSLSSVDCELELSSLLRF